jgi:serine protease Do
MRKLILIIVILIIVSGIWNGLGLFLPQIEKSIKQYSLTPIQQQPVKVTTEESVTINDVKTIGSSVVTVVNNAQSVSTNGQSFQMGPFSMFEEVPQDNTPTPQSIGSGFIISQDGLIVTNKHVVSDTSGTYQIITANDKKYDVKQIYRDPLNDIAILKIDPSQNPLKAVSMGDSSHLQVGQFVVAIGTALGEFRNTVTTGVISGLGRGIQAGDIYQGYIEQLDNVIQTSAPINPGNSGGPLVNSNAEVIGINTAVAQNGQNIGFALPINVVKDSLSNFNKTGQFNRPYLGVAYKFIPQDIALLNNVPSGAYVQTVVSNSPAEKAGIKVGDIIVKIDGKRIDDMNNSLVSIISQKKIGDTITVTVWRESNSIDLKVLLLEASNHQ